MHGQSTVGSALKSSTPLRVSRYRVPWPGLSRPRVVVHLTDIHVGWTTPQSLLRCVAAVAREEKPDLVALTGDYVNASRTFVRRLASFVAALPPPVVAVLGNHDHLCGAQAIARCLESAGACVLRNESCDIGGLRVVGIDDGFTGKDDPVAAFSQVAQPSEALVLTHFPPTAARLSHSGAGRLVLAGHTHAGQVDMPARWMRTFAYLTRLGPFLRGFHDLPGGVRLYVNAGLGHSRRGMRWGGPCRPEMAVFRLEPE